MTSLFLYLHTLAVAVLVGKCVFLSFVVAPILAKTLDQASFGRVVRRLFPAYYLLGMGAAFVGLVAGTVLVSLRGVSFVLLAAGAIWLVIFAAESYCRSPLTPRSNAMRDRLKEEERLGTVDPTLQSEWNQLHQRSIYLNSMVLFAGLGLVWLVR